MISTNFEFLRAYRPELAELGAFAERYAYTDPVSAMVKLRSFAEALTWEVYRVLSLERPVPDDFVHLLTTWQFKTAIPRIVQDQFHAIRKAGNRAAHANDATSKTAITLLQEGYHLGAWFAAQFHKLPQPEIPAFRSIPIEAASTEREARLSEQHRAALEELARQKSQLDRIVEELSSTQKQYEEAERRIEELQAVAAQGQQTLNLLQLDEAATRHRLIDVALVEAGWDVGSSGVNTEQVSLEYEVDGQPTATGKGYVDYVLWGANGQPLAVVEAKRTSRDAEQGRKQAELYADALEAKFGKRPVLFYTNGYDIFFWDDKSGYPPRRLFGFHAPDTLEYRVTFQRAARKPLNTVSPRADITDRLYQLEAIKRVCEDLAEKKRRALIVQATGTGKTRVAIAIVDLLIRAGWARRVLFLCDRRELRKQAKDAFGEFLNEPLTIANASTATDKNKRIYLATYPAMMQAFQNFDTGFFDLVIADETHRSIYNVYGDLFKYFDALQIGLTATPVSFISRNTFRLFDCGDLDPTANYPLERAVEEGWLVPYEVFSHTTQFLRQGIKYDDLNDDQKRQIEEDGIDPALIDHDADEIDKQVFNKDTNREILRNLMENGIRERSSQRIGKTIVFARGHKHALLLQELFDEMYPQYGGKFCQVIDNYVERADQLIGDFKGLGTNPDLTIAISVDMLDTGIDVPEIVNLVFAKPVKSKVKFWQMIGRGTRLSKNLFGPGNGKKKFYIFDHWSNFEFFGQPRPEAQPTRTPSLLEQLFHARMSLADEALRAAKPSTFDWVVRLIAGDVASLPDDTIAVREHWQQKQTVLQAGRLEQWSASTIQILERDIAPLMQWVDIGGAEPAHSLDLLIAQMQALLLRGAGTFDNKKAELLNRVNNLQMNLNQVREKAEVIRRARSAEFWNTVTVESLEEIRRELRGIMKFQQRTDPPGFQPIIYDIAEDRGQIRHERRSSLVASVDMVAYRQRVEAALKDLFTTTPTLEKIRLGLPVTEADLQALVSLVLTQHPDINLNDLLDFYPDTASRLDDIIRTIVGMDTQVVRERFTAFVQRFPSLTAKQTQFINMLVGHIARFGAITVERLYEAPFTALASDGPDGVFPDEAQIRELLAIVGSFRPKGLEDDYTQ